MKYGLKFMMASFRAGLIISAVFIALLMGGLHTVKAPQDDSVQYVTYARTLCLTGNYAETEAGALADATAGREPLYPALIAVVGHIMPSLGQTLTSCGVSNGSCSNGYQILVLLNALLLAGGAVFAGLSAWRLSDSRWSAGIACAYIMFNFQMQRDIVYIVSDFLAVFLVGALTYMLTVPLARRTPIWGGGVGLTLGALCLTKAVFLPFAVLIILALIFYGFFQRAYVRQSLQSVCLIACVVFSICGGWTARNYHYFGATDDGRGSIAFSTREALNHMTGEEHLAAWLYWTRGFGDNLAKKIFPISAWQRHEMEAADGFYQQGQIHKHEARVAALMKSQNLSRAQAGAAAKGVVIREIIADLPNYILTLPVVFYRGIWFDEFIVIGLPLLLVFLVRGVAQRRWFNLIAVTPGLWSLIIYPAISLNIPRYQFTSVIVLAIAVAIVSVELIEKYILPRIAAYRTNTKGI